MSSVNSPIFNRNSHSRILSLFVILGVYFAVRPYLGIVHDGRFYALDALVRQGGRARGAADLAPDVYLRFGSQGNFSLFPVLYGPLLRLLGTSNGAILCWAATSVLWVSGYLYFASRMVTGVPAKSLVLAVPVALSAHQYFTYAENFMTARLVSEALALWGLGLALRQRTAPSLVILALACAVHPLFGAGPAAVAVIFRWGRKAWLWLGLIPSGLAVVVLAAALHIAPFSDALRSYDPEWFRIVSKRDGFCFVSNWSWTVWAQLVAFGIMLVLSWGRLVPPVRSMVPAVLIVAVGSLIVSVIGSDLAHNVLIVGLQPWRAVWVLALVGNLALASVVSAGASQGLRSMSMGNWLIALSILSSCIEAVFPAMSVIAAPLMLIAALLIAVEHRWPQFSPAPESFFAHLIVGLIAGFLLLLAYVAAGIRDDTPWADLGVLQAARWRSASLMLLAVVLAIGGWSSLRQRPLMVWSAFAATAILTVDARSPWARFVEASEKPPAIEAHFPDKGDILWEGDLRAPWLLLRRASYISCDQGTGALFNRRTAAVYASRVDQVSAVTAFEATDFCPMTKRVDARTTVQAIRSLCRAAPDLAYLVTGKPVEGLVSDEVPVPPHEVVLRDSDGVSRQRIERQYIYRCASLRSGQSGVERP